MATFPHPAYTPPFRNTNHFVYRDNWNIQLTKPALPRRALPADAYHDQYQQTGRAGGRGRYPANILTLRTPVACAATWIETGKVMPVPGRRAEL